MGVQRDVDHEPAEAPSELVDLEDGEIREQMVEAQKRRPELLAFEEKMRSEALLMQSWRWNYAPTIGLGMGLTDAGTDISSLVWNWTFTGSAQWLMFDQPTCLGVSPARRQLKLAQRVGSDPGCQC